MYIIIFQSDKQMVNNITYFTCLLLTITLTLPQPFSIDTTHPLLLLSNATINNICRDYQNYFIVAFSNGQVRRYTPDFSSYVDLSFPQAVQLFLARGFASTINLANGSSFSMNDRFIIARSNNQTTVRDYNYYTYALLYTYNTNSTIINQIGFPFTVANSTRTFHALLTTDYVQVVYKGSVVAQLTWSDIFGGSLYCITAVTYSYPMATNGDNITANLYFYLSLSNKQVHLLSISILFTFNHTINHYSISALSSNKNLVYTSPTLITYLKSTNGLLMMQSNSTGVTTIYDVSTSTIGTTINIPLNQTMNFVYAYNTYYLLQSTGLYALNYTSTNRTLSLNTTLNALPYDSYSFNFGVYFHLFYTPGKGIIYKGGSCTGQSFISGSTCVVYNCSVDNCSSCFIIPSICTLCQQGYSLNQNNYTCFLTPTITPSQIQFVFFNSAITYSVELISKMISMPAARRFISPAFVYFGIFDDLYLYQFHDRLYGSTINDLFSTINGIQTKKWSFINYQKILSFCNIDSTSFVNITNYQDPYDYYHFTHQDHTEVGPQGLWNNCQNYFLVSIPITIVGFILLRVLFKLLYNYPVSKLFRKFDFWPYLFIILLDGNIQQLSFYLVTDWKNIFAFNPYNKMLKIYCLMFGFGVVLLSTSLYFISYHLYNQLNKHLTDNHNNDIVGIAMLISQNGLKNVIFGVLHSILRGFSYEEMLGSLLICQFVFNCILVVSVSMGIYKINAKLWIYTLLNLIKMTIIGTFFIDYNSINVPIIQNTQQILILLQVLIFSLGVVHQLVLAVVDMVAMGREIFSPREKVVGKEGEESKCLKQQLSRNGIIIYVSNLKNEAPKQISQISTFNQLDQKCKKFKVNKQTNNSLPKLGTVTNQSNANTHRISFNIRYVTRKLNNILGKD